MGPRSCEPLLVGGAASPTPPPLASTARRCPTTIQRIVTHFCRRSRASWRLQAQVVEDGDAPDGRGHRRLAALFVPALFHAPPRADREPDAEGNADRARDAGEGQ